MSGLRVLLRLRADARNEAQEAFARRLAELRLAEELLRRATARWAGQRGRLFRRAESKLSELGRGRAATARAHGRHESRLRAELEALAFGREIARGELASRSSCMETARAALARAETSLTVLERLLERRREELHCRRRRREEEVH